MVCIFVDMGSPPEREWSGPGGVLAEIRKALRWHYDRDLTPIKVVLRRHLAGASWAPKTRRGDAAGNSAAGPTTRSRG